MTNHDFPPPSGPPSGPPPGPPAGPRGPSGPPPQGSQPHGFQPPPQHQGSATPAQPAFAAPGAPGRFGTSGGQPPFRPEGPGAPHPSARPRRGPGWPALIAACLVCGLVGGGAAAGIGVALDSGRSGFTPASSAPAAPAPPLGDGTLDWTQVAAAVSPSVVSIQVAGAAGSGSGSGVIIDDRGHILSNNHVVSGASQLQVVLSDGRLFTDIEVVGTDPATDLAVIRLVNPPSDLTALPFGDSSQVVPGQPVMAVGNPLGLADTVTTGIVSATDRPVNTPQATTTGIGRGNERVVTNAIQTDAAINPGNSGGALVDSTGSLIGIPSSIAALAVGSGSEVGSIGLGFAIPSNEAQRIAGELIKNGKASHSWLGVSIEDARADVDGQSRLGARIGQVLAESAAERAGLQVGDVVTGIDGEPTPGADSLTAQVRERAPGDEVALTVVRNGTSLDVQVELGVRPLN